MVKIETVNTYGPPARLKKKGASQAKSSFHVATGDAHSAEVTVGTPQSAAEITSLSQLMHIQEVGDYERGTQQAVAGGESLLASLEHLQNAILMGTVSKDSLGQIVALTTTLPNQIDNDNLKQVIAEIKQRALIEIAKLGKGSK